MTTREKTLAVFVLPLLLLVAAYLFFMQLYLKPLQARDNRIAELKSDIEERELQQSQIIARKKDQEKYKIISLPADADLARREYEDQLSKLLRASGFEAGSFSVTPKPIDIKTSPTQLNKKPIYSKLSFQVQAKGELPALVDFLERVYKLPLLHQVHNILLQRPLSGQNRSSELDINLTIEALVLDNAETRKTLLPAKPPELPPVLAEEPRKYASIGGKNIFFGPPAPPPAAPTVKKSDIDFAKHIKFVSSTDGDAGPEAILFDAYGNQEYSIRPRKDGGGFRIEVSFVVNNHRRTLRSGKAIEIMDESGELQHRWMVVRMTERDLYLQDEDFFYSLHIGQWLSEIVKLSTQDAAALGLTPAKKEPEPATK